MSRLIITRAHDLSFEDLCAEAEALAEKLRRQYGGSWRWEEDCLHYNYSGGVDAIVWVDEDELTIEVKLGMMMGMMRRPIEREINVYLDQHIG